jgi:hypothetical protein
VGFASFPDLFIFVIVFRKNLREQMEMLCALIHYVESPSLLHQDSLSL